MHCRLTLCEQWDLCVMHVRRIAMAPFLSHNRGGEAEELWNGGAIISKLVANIMNYSR